MTVKELIEKLATLPEDLPVVRRVVIYRPRPESGDTFSVGYREMNANDVNELSDYFNPLQQREIKAQVIAID